MPADERLQSAESVLVAAHGDSLWRARSGGYRWINSVGNLAGYLSPAIVGRIRDTTCSRMLALLVLSTSSLIGGLAALAASRRRP